MGYVFISSCLFAKFVCRCWYSVWFLLLLTVLVAVVLCCADLKESSYPSQVHRFTSQTEPSSPSQVHQGKSSTLKLAFHTFIHRARRSHSRVVETTTRSTKACPAATIRMDSISRQHKCLPSCDCTDRSQKPAHLQLYEWTRSVEITCISRAQS